MQSYHPYSLFHLGDSALCIDFGNEIDEDINKKLITLYDALRNSGIPFIVDLVPAYSSLAVYYDVVALKKSNPGQTAFDTMAEMIDDYISHRTAQTIREARSVEVPVCYSDKFAPDLNLIAAIKNISASELVKIHTSVVYRVYMLGFLPGFAYMGSVDERIAVPRKEEPRKDVATGSVGIAGRQTGIYPLQSPGGWQIIGRTPWRLFDPYAEKPVLFEPGMQVKFYSISEDEFENYQGGTV